MALLLDFNLSVMQFQQFSNYLPIGEPRVKQIIVNPTKKSSKFGKCPSKLSLAVDISKNVPIMHKTLALREESKIFRGNQLTQDD